MPDDSRSRSRPSLDDISSNPSDTTSAGRRGSKRKSASIGAAIGVLFRDARLALGLSQYELAELTEDARPAVSRTAISDIERGRTVPGIETIVALCAVLYLEPSDVIEQVVLAPPSPWVPDGVSFDELARRARELATSRDGRRAVPYYDAMIAMAESDPSAAAPERRARRARAEIDRAGTLASLGALRAARNGLERAIETSATASDAHLAEIAAEAYVAYAGVLSESELVRLGHDMAIRAVEAAGGASVRVRASAAAKLGDLRLRVGAIEEARRAFGDALELAESADDVALAAHAEGRIGTCMEHTGKTEHAKRRLIGAVKRARAHGDRGVEAEWTVELAEFSLRRDDSDGADRLARAAGRDGRAMRDPLVVFRAEWVRHGVHRRRNPDAPDRHRMARLKKLFRKIRGGSDLAAVREFREAILEERTARGR